MSEPASAATAISGLSGLGLVTMIVSLSGVLILLIWCYAKILGASGSTDD